MSADETLIELDDLTQAAQLLECLERTRLDKSESAVEVALALAMAVRSAQLLAFQHLAQVKDRFPAPIQAVLARPEAAVSLDRDLQGSTGDSLSFANILDLLSEKDLPCISMGLHRGWQDKRQSCRQARGVTCTAVGFYLNKEERDHLLMASVLLSRTLEMPLPARVDLDELRGAVRRVLALITRLTSEETSEIEKRCTRICEESD